MPSEEITLSPKITWKHRGVRDIVVRVVRLFYPNIQAYTPENLPPEGTPTIFALNHPNFVLDRLMMTAGLGRQSACLAKSTFFRHPIARLTMEAFHVLPIYRKKDDGQPYGPRGDASERNAKILAFCRSLLYQGRSFAIFPEGTTHSENRLYELQPGAARIGLEAEAEHDWRLGVRVVPVGVYYEDKTKFRSHVHVAFGEPLLAQDYRADYEADSRQAAQTMTDVLTTRLLATVALARNGAAQAKQSQKSVNQTILITLALIVTSPLAAIGLMTHALPYWLNLPLAHRLLNDQATRAATAKMLAGLILLPLTWLLWAIIVGLLTGPLWGVLTFFMLPLLGYCTVRWLESARQLFQETLQPSYTASLSSSNESIAESKS